MTETGTVTLIWAMDHWVHFVPSHATSRKINFSLEELQLVLQKISAHFQVLQGIGILAWIQQNMT